MKRSELIKTISLTIILVFAISSVAGAGAVIRRGDSGSKGSDKQEKPKVARPAERPASPPARSSEPRDNGNSKTYKPSTPARPSGSSGATMRDRVPDATPSYRPSNNRAGNDKNYDRRPDSSRDDSKYGRVGERYDPNRGKYDQPRSYRPPTYRSGYYYYDHGWPYRSNYPLHYAHWVFDRAPNYTRPSAYYYYGYFPYIPSARVIIVRRPAVTYIEIPIVIKDRRSDEGYYLDDRAPSSIDAALSNIRRAWTNRYPDLLLRHVKTSTTIDVLIDGEYSYSLSSADYRDMTRDAIRTTRTIDFTFDSIRGRGDDRVIAYGRHRFYTLDSAIKTVYISYELERRGGEWVLTEVGSSLAGYGY